MKASWNETHIVPQSCVQSLSRSHVATTAMSLTSALRLPATTPLTFAIMEASRNDPRETVNFLDKLRSASPFNLPGEQPAHLKRGHHRGARNTSNNQTYNVEAQRMPPPLPCRPRWECLPRKHITTNATSFMCYCADNQEQGPSAHHEQSKRESCMVLPPATANNGNPALTITPVLASAKRSGQHEHDVRPHAIRCQYHP